MGFFETVLYHLSEPVAVLHKGVFVFSTPAYAALLGLSEKELLGLRMESLLEASGAETWSQALSQVQGSREATEVRARLHQDPQGGLERSWHLTPFQQGETQYIQVGPRNRWIWDATRSGRKDSEAFRSPELEAGGTPSPGLPQNVRERRYQTLFETMTEGFLLCEFVQEEAGEMQACRILDANPAFERATGLTLSEILHLDPVAVLPPLEGYIRRILEDRANPGSAPLETLMLPELGHCFQVRSFWPDANQVALLFSDVTERWKVDQRRHRMNEELEILVRVRTRALEMAIEQLNSEITERKQVEAALRASEEEFRLVAEFTYDWEYWISPEGRHLYVSPSCEQVTGYPPQAFKDDPGLLEQIIHPEDLPALVEHQRIGDGESAACGVDFRIIRPDGGTRWISHWCLPVFGSDGAYLGRRASNRDVSEMKRRDQLHTARLELLEKLAAKGTLEQCFRILLEHVAVVFPGYSAAILILDPASGCLHSVDSIGLPQFFNAALEGLEIRPEMGSFDPACWEPTVAEDLQAHPHWASYRELARKAGLGACWSEPILANTDQHVLGVLVVYPKAPGRPVAQELGLLQEAARLAGMAINRIGSEATLRKLSTAVEASPAGMVITDTEGTIEYVNPRFTQITGYSLEEVLGQNPKILQSGQTPVAVYEEMWATLHEGRFWRGELRNRRKNGELYWQKLSIAPIRDASGTIRNMVGITEDISERRGLEEARRQLEMAVNQSMDAMVLLGSENQIIFANPTFYRTHGLSAEEAAGKDLVALLKRTSGGTILTRALELAWEGRSWQGRIALGLGSSSSRVQLEGAIVPVRGLDGEIKGLLAVGRDVTKEVEADRHLRQVQKMDALGALASGIVHDFNNILSVILAASEIMEWQLDEQSPARSKLEVIYQAARRAQELNKQILSFSRNSEDKQIPFDLSGVAKETIKLLRTTLPANIAFQAKIASSVWVSGDPGQINQVILNLAINGYHAMKEEGGSLDLSLAEVELGAGTPHQPSVEGRFALLTVRDTGCGMSPEILEKIFEPFFTTKPQGEGTGLGLSVVNGIVHKHGGNIQVSSEPGKGTTFQVFLPCTVAGAPLITSEPHEELGGSERILVVEDEDIVAALTKQGLQALGYNVTAKTSSVDALELFQAKPDDFDLVVTDLAMPDLSGAELTMRLRTIRPELPVILLSGAFNAPDTTLGLSVSYDEILAKPMVPKELARAIRRTVECHRRQTPPNGFLESAFVRADGTEAPLLPGIILAVDNSVTRSQLRSWLAKGGHRVREAKDGQAAWELFCAAEDPLVFSLIITDLVMPRMDGLELVEKVRRKDVQIPIMVLTETDDVETLKKGITLHVSEFLQKPFASKELLEHVNRLAADRRNELQVHRLAKTAQAVRLAQKRMEAMPEQDLPVYSICEPLTEAGGDVFRCIRRPDGSVVLILADVAGHSIASSYAVASFLGMLSTFVQDWWGVKDLFYRLNQNILMGPFPESPIAVLVAHWNPASGRMHVVNAGIPHGIWHRKALGRTETIPLNGLPLGLLDDPLVEEKVLVLEEGDRVLFGTDGLFDTRSPDLVYFRDRVPLHWEQGAELPMELALGALCDAIKTHGNGKILDDVLVVGLEQAPWIPEPDELLRVFPSEKASVDLADHAMEALLADCPPGRELDASQRFDLFLALHEALNNAIEHGNKGDAGKRIALACRLIEDTAHFRVVDEGCGFDLEGLVSPDISTSERGRGLPILRFATRGLRMRGGELEFQFDLKGAVHATHS